MSFDLALSENFDLILSGHRDIAGTSGIPLLEQRIKLRLKIMRGSWLYDADKSLGSTLHTLLGKRSDEVATLADAMVRDALRTMREVDVAKVNTVISGNSLSLTVFYRIRAPENVSGTSELQSMEITLDAIGNVNTLTPGGAE